MAQGRDTGRVEAVVDPDSSRTRDARSPGPAVSSYGNEWSDPSGASHCVRVGIEPFPGQGQRQKARVSWRRFDREGVAAGPRFAELEGADRLQRAAPHVDRLVE